MSVLLILQNDIISIFQSLWPRMFFEGDAETNWSFFFNCHFFFFSGLHVQLTVLDCSKMVCFDSKVSIENVETEEFLFSLGKYFL